MALMTIILALSVVCQLLSAILALRLIRVTGRMAAWSLIALAIMLMTLRRAESLVLVVSDATVAPADYVFEILGLVVSAVMLAGIYHINPLFTALARSREELRSMNAKLSALSEERQLLLDHTKDFIYRHDPTGQITYVSPAVEKITGYRPDEWLAHYSVHYADNAANRNGRESEEMLKTGTGGSLYRGNKT